MTTNAAITVRVSYSDGDSIITTSASLVEAKAYFFSFERIYGDFRTGEETRAHCVGVQDITRRQG